MLSEELVSLAQEAIRQKCETQTLELKTSHGGCPTRLYDTLSSFSNQDGGGVILFGIDEQNGYRPVGVYDLQDLQKKVTEQCKQMEPPVRATFTVAEYDGIPICCAEIPGLDLAERPCFYKGVGRIKGSFVRVGDADLPMTDYELYSFEAFRKHQHDDERPVERAQLDMLKQDELQRYLLQMKTDRPGFSQLDERHVYEMLAITRDETPTLAAVLNFGIYPQGYFPQLAITAIVVPGENIGDLSGDAKRFLNNKRLEGTLAEMLEESMAFCKRNMKTQTIIDPQTGQRADRTEYPLEAIREALLNALIHRDYSHYTEGTPIQLDFFSNRLEIHSPGSLYGRMTVDQLGHARPDLRNPALATMAEFLLQTENRYSGIPTMRREMAAAGLPAPKFENQRNEFVVTFFNSADNAVPQGEVKGGSAEQRLLTFCQTPRTRKEIADFLAVSNVYYAIQHYVQPLLKAQKLVMSDPAHPKNRNQTYKTK